jgi:probable rRNA maturation factor
VDLDHLGALLASVLAAEGAPGCAEASLTLVDPERIAVLKSEHLGGDGSPTDVLSFPLDGAAPDAQLVGDVVVCPAVAAVQAPAHAGTLVDELRLLVVHGALHLAGWDHADPDGERAMWARERALMERLGVAPMRDPWVGGVDGSDAAGRAR